MNEWKGLPQPVVGPLVAHLDRKLDKAPKANEPLSRDVVARKRTSLDLVDFLALVGKGRHGKRRAKAQALAQKRTSRGCGEARKTTTREPPLGPNPGPFSGPDSGPDSGAGFRPLIIIHLVGRNPAPESGPESGPQNGTAFGAFLGQFREQGAPLQSNFLAQEKLFCDLMRVAWHVALNGHNHNQMEE